MQNPTPNAQPKFTYARRSPEDSLLRKLFVAEWPGLQREIREKNDGYGLPPFITKAVDKFLDCGVLSKGFIRVYCHSCRTDQFVAFSCKCRGICASCDGKRMCELAAHLVDSVIPAVPIRQFVLTFPAHIRYVLAWNSEFRNWVLAAIMRALEKHYVDQALATGAVEPQFAAISVLQRFDGALRIFPHWHILAADGVWHRTADGLKFLPAPRLYTELVADLLADIAKRVTRQADRFFAKRADADGKVGPADPVMANLLQYSLFGPQELERVVPPAATGKSSRPKMKSRNCVDLDGFNLHADVRIHEVARERLEHLVRYVCRPVIAAKRLEAVGDHKVRITFKNEWKGGVTGVTLTKRDLALRIVAQIPLPRRATLRYHGIFGPAAKDRELVVPARGGRVAHNKRKGKAKCEQKAVDGAAGRENAAEPAAEAKPEIKLVGTAAEKYGRVASDESDGEKYTTKMTWADCLKRAFL